MVAILARRTEIDPVPDEPPGDADYLVEHEVLLGVPEVIDGQEVVLVERQPKGVAENPVEGRRWKTEGRSFGDFICRLEVRDDW